MKRVLRETGCKGVEGFELDQSRLSGSIIAGNSFNYLVTVSVCGIPNISVGWRGCLTNQMALSNGPVVPYILSRYISY
jgi:hypothetical protein